MGAQNNGRRRDVKMVCVDSAQVSRTSSQSIGTPHGRGKGLFFLKGRTDGSC